MERDDHDWPALAKELGEEIWQSLAIIDLTHYLENALRKRKLFTQAHLAKNFDPLKISVSLVIQRKIRESTESGLPPRYKFSEADKDVLIPLTDVSTDEIRSQISNTIRTLTWRQFECLSVHVLHVDGVKPCEVGRGSKEEGIDLYGALDLGSITGRSIWHGVSLRILGQAKMSRVKQNEVRLFHTDIESCASKKGKSFDLAPHWFKQISKPILGIMLTAKGFTRGATEWANRESIVAKDATQMVEDLIRAPSQTPGLSVSNGRITWNEGDFLQQLKLLDRSAFSKRRSQIN